MKSDKTKKKRNNATKLTAEETLELISQQWATAYDIMKIGNCGKNKAQRVKKQIKDSIKTELGKELPYGVVPMEKVVDYYQININYLKKVSNFQKK